MGFFSSPKPEASGLSVDPSEASLNPSEKTAVQLFRTRLHRKLTVKRQGSSSKHSSIHDQSPSPSAFNKAHSQECVSDERALHVMQHSSSDSTTIALAQNLNELASANANGLLTDDEYRTLRQGLFERFASPPVEPLRMKATTQTQTKLATASSPSRAPSVRTQSSVRSAMSKVFRRAKQSIAETNFQRDQDGMSVVSVASSSRRAYPSTPYSLAHQPSLSSFSVDLTPNMPTNLRAISSRRSVRNVAHHLDPSAKPLRPGRLNPEEPPSSFRPLVSMKSWTADDSPLRTTKELRAEISATEAEQQRLLYAFEALEDAAALRGQHDANGLMVPEGHALAGSRMPDNSLLASSPLSRHGQGFQQYGYSRGPSELITAHRSNVVQQYWQGEVDIDDMRCRRIAIDERFERRLEYLRARLKGAEIHERLLKK